MKEKKNSNTNWAALTKERKAIIELSLQQLNEGKGIPIQRAMAQLTKKYVLSQKAK